MNGKTRYPTRTIVSKSISQINEMLAEMTRSYNFTRSVLIVQDGKVPIKKGYGFADRTQRISNTPQTRFRLAFISKQFTAMAILILQAQGKLRIEDPLNNYITCCPSLWRGISIHHLLTHTSGLSCKLWPLLMESTEHPELMRGTGQPTTLFAEYPLDFQPGEQFAYSNPGYILLDLVIQYVSGQSYADFLKHAIFILLEMHHLGYDDRSNQLASGYIDCRALSGVALTWLPFPNGACQLFSTVEDLFLWDQALDTNRLLPQNEICLMFQPYVCKSNSPGFGYGYGWYVGNYYDQPVVAHAGDGNGFSSLIIRHLADRLTGILLIIQQDIDPIPIWASIHNNLVQE